MNSIPYSHIAKGSLLIASPDIDAGLYFRSVILLCEHNVTGSFGLILNKPLDVELPEEIINIKNLVNPNVSIRAGGPSHPNQMMLLHANETLEDQTLQICDHVFLGGDLEFLQRSIEEPDGSPIRLCFGYCAWGPSQLEKELLTGQWFLYQATQEHVFHTPPEKLWQSILRQMGGKYATLSMIPEDLSLN
ncbi:MAG: YqgE/AlgH family protein [Verrucomicrobia bacterium]|nr:YqgE/AlgH family protein [Verrucomicrobiota bacterium]